GDLRRRPECIFGLADMHRRVWKCDLLVGGEQARRVVGVEVREDHHVDRRGIDTSSGEILGHPAERRAEQVRGTGVDQNKLVGGIDEPLVDCGWYYVPRQEAAFKEF